MSAITRILCGHLPARFAQEDRLKLKRVLAVTSCTLVQSAYRPREFRCDQQHTGMAAGHGWDQAARAVRPRVCATDRTRPAVRAGCRRVARRVVSC
jgi:hypothetical protein